MKKWRTRIACGVRKATNTHSEYATINVFPLKQWLQELASRTGYTYVACLVEDCLDGDWIKLVKSSAE
jgi:hypothetical protein